MDQHFWRCAVVYLFSNKSIKVHSCSIKALATTLRPGILHKCSAGMEKAPGDVTNLGMGVCWVVFKLLVIVETVCFQTGEC